MSENNNPVSIETWFETESEQLYAKYKQLYAKYKQLDGEHGEHVGGVHQYIDERLGIIEKYKQLIVERERLDDKYKQLDDEHERVYDEIRRFDDERERLDDECKRLDAKRSELLDSEQLDDGDVDHFEGFDFMYGECGWEYPKVSLTEINTEYECGRYIIARERLKPIINSLGVWLDARRAGRVASTLRYILNDNSTSAEDIECAIQIIRIRKAFQKEYLDYIRAEGLESVIKDIEGISSFIYEGIRLIYSGDIHDPSDQYGGHIAERIFDKYGRLITGFVDGYGNFEYWGFEELECNI